MPAAAHAPSPMQLEAILDADAPDDAGEGEDKAEDKAEDKPTGAAAAKTCMEALMRWSKIADDKELWVKYNLSQGHTGIAIKSLNKVRHPMSYFATQSV